MVSASHRPAPIKASTTRKRRDIDHHAVAIVVGAFAALEFGKIVHRRRNIAGSPVRRPGRRRNLTTRGSLSDEDVLSLVMTEESITARARRFDRHGSAQ